MKVKTLLLGSAAAVAAAGGAQAADLTIAAPVEYVRVCDAFGTGYWYLPGTDTCIKVGGEVTFDVNFHSMKTTLSGTDIENEVLGTGTGYQGDFDDSNTYGTNHAANWDFVTGAKISLTGKSITELGELTASVTIAAKSENKQQAADFVSVYHHYGPDTWLSITHGQNSIDRLFNIDEAYLELGWFSAGYRDSTFQYSGGYAGSTTYRGNQKTDQVRLTWAMGGFSLMLAAEDPRDRWGTTAGSNINMPDLIAAVTWKQGSWDGKLSFGFAGPVGNGPLSDYCCFYGNVWGINLGMTFKLDSIAKGDALRLNAAVGTGSSFVTGTSNGKGAVNGATNWSAFASFQHYFTPTWSAALTGAVVGNNYAGQVTRYAISGGLVWAPVNDFSVQTRVIYEDTNGSSSGGGSWAGRVEFKRSIDP